MKHQLKSRAVAFTARYALPFFVGQALVHAVAWYLMAAPVLHVRIRRPQMIGRGVELLALSGSVALGTCFVFAILGKIRLSTDRRVCRQDAMAAGALIGAAPVWPAWIFGPDSLVTIEYVSWWWVVGLSVASGACAAAFLNEQPLRRLRTAVLKKNRPRPKEAWRNCVICDKVHCAADARECPYCGTPFAP